MPGALRSQTTRSNVEEDASQQARDFHFAVTWIELFAHLNLIESSGPRRKVETPPQALAVVPAPSRAEPEAAWEMVVPKMVRTNNGNFTPAERGKRQLL